MADSGVNAMAQKLSDPIVFERCETFKQRSTNDDRTLFLEGYPTHLICINVDPQKLHAHLTLISYQEDIARITTLLEGVSSSIGLELDEVSQACLDKIRQSNSLKLEEIIQEDFAQGTPAIPEKPPYLVLHVKPFTSNPSYDQNDDGSVDFHNLNLFQNVIENQHIADHIEGELGIPGRDVFGIQINPHQKKKHHITCGHGVAFDENAGQYFSTIAGYVTHEDDRLSVNDCYTVNQHVDMAIGNINFVSDVLVKGDVLPDFSIQAGRSIEIYGSVSGAMLQAEKDIKLQRGILGQSKSIVKANGQFSAKFANETTIEARGNIEIFTEALNSDVGTLKQILGKQAVFIGGRIVSVEEMHLGTVGSELGIRTEVFLGQDFSLLRRTDEIRKLLLEMEDLVEGRLEGLTPEVRHWQTDHIKETKDTDNLNELLPRLEELQALINELVLTNQEYELLNQNSPANQKPICYVHKKIYPETVFYCAGDVHRVKEEITGPVTVKAQERSARGRSKIVIEEGLAQ